MMIDRVRRIASWGGTTVQEGDNSTQVTSIKGKRFNLPRQAICTEMQRFSLYTAIAGLLQP